MFNDAVRKVTDKISGKVKESEITFTPEEDVKAQDIFARTEGSQEDKYVAVQKFYAELAEKKNSNVKQETPKSEPTLFNKAEPVARIEKIETKLEEPEMGSPESGLQKKIYKFVKEGVKAEYTGNGLRLTYTETIDGKPKKTTAEFGLVYQLSEPLETLIDGKVGTIKKANNSKMQLLMAVVVSVIVFYAGSTFLLPRMSTFVSRADFDTNVGGMADTISTMQKKLNDNDRLIKQLQDRLNQDEIILQEVLK